MPDLQEIVRKLHLRTARFCTGLAAFFGAYCLAVGAGPLQPFWVVIPLTGVLNWVRVNRLGRRGVLVPIDGFYEPSPAIGNSIVALSAGAFFGWILARGWWDGEVAPIFLTIDDRSFSAVTQPQAYWATMAVLTSAVGWLAWKVAKDWFPGLRSDPFAFDGYRIEYEGSRIES